MKTFIGFSLIILGILLGLYLGVWVMFIGGIIQVVQNITPVVNALGIALGLLRFMASSLVGWLSFVILFGIGKTLLE